jgi:DNA-binding FadR family transcriptional regulator
MARSTKVISNHVAEAVQRELESHKELYEAIRSRDPEKARASMRAHLEEAKKLVTQGFTGEVEKKAGEQTDE